MEKHLNRLFLGREGIEGERERELITIVMGPDPMGGKKEGRDRRRA